MAVCRASARRALPFLSSTVGPKPPPPPKSPIRASSVSLRVSAGFRLAGLLGRSLAELACFHTRSGVDPVHSTLGKDPAHSTQAALASRCCTGAPSWASYTLVTLARTTSAYVRRTGFASREERGVIPHTTVRAVRQDAAQSVDGQNDAPPEEELMSKARRHLWYLEEEAGPPRPPISMLDMSNICLGVVQPFCPLAAISLFLQHWIGGAGGGACLPKN